MKTAVLLSGGVDSTMAAYLLKQRGHEIIGLTMINWDEEVAAKAKEAAEWLGIEHHITDLRDRFSDQVIEYFCTTYEKGHTPNPCVLCNQYIKFGLLLDMAREIGCEYVATGHYAQIEFNSNLNEYQLLKGIDPQKDQSYFLYRLSQAQLARIVFPLGEMHKTEVINKASALSVPAARSKESQEICFVSGDYRDFLQDRISFEPGNIIDREGNLLGRHKGLPFYTIGQRKGLGVSGGRPLYVIDMDREQNRLILGEDKYLLKSRVILTDLHFISQQVISLPLKVETKIRYASKPSLARLSNNQNGWMLEFDTPQRAITPGQSAVFYLGDRVVGGGIITG